MGKYNMLHLGYNDNMNRYFDCLSIQYFLNFHEQFRFKHSIQSKKYIYIAL